MSVDWRRLAAAAKLSVRGDAVYVGVPDGRHQTVQVDESEADMLRAWSIVAKAAVVRQIDEPRLQAWRRNRLSELVGFRVDALGRMIGETFISLPGCGAEELGLHIRVLARACDRFELLLTGSDDE